MLIVLDGIDGAGKSTQTKMLIKRLKKEGYAVATLDFPQYAQNFFGGMVKQFLNGEFGGINKVDPHLASLLYALDRWESKAKIQQWLKQKKIAVINRYTTANLIHQSIKLPSQKRAVFANLIEKLEYAILGMPKPNMVIYLSLPHALAYALIIKRGKKKDIHEKDRKHLCAAAQYGLELARKKRWHIIHCHKNNVMRSKEDIAAEIWKTIHKKIKNPVLN